MSIRDYEPTYSDGKGGMHRAYQLPWEVMQKVSVHAHEGTLDDDELLVAYLIGGRRGHLGRVG